MSTNTETSTEVTFATVEEYRAADAKGKAAIRNAAKAAMKAAVKAGDIAGAMAAQAAEDSYTSDKPAKVTVDPYAVLAHRIQTLRTAAEWLESGAVLPDGLTIEGDFDADRLTEALGNVEEDLDSVAKVAGHKLTRSGTRSDVGAAIEAAFDDLPKGTFLTVQEITNKMSLPSSGAVAVRLFPKKGKCTVKGVTPVAGTATSPKGAKKA